IEFKEFFLFISMIVAREEAQTTHFLYVALTTKQTRENAKQGLTTCTSPRFLHGHEVFDLLSINLSMYQHIVRGRAESVGSRENMVGELKRRNTRESHIMDSDLEDYSTTEKAP